MHRWLLPSLMLMSLFGNQSAARQEQDKQAAVGPTDDAAAKQKPPAREEHVIYVPFDKIKDVFEKEEASVFLPYAQFLQMWGQMRAPLVPLPVKPPVTGMITRAEYAGAVEGELVRLRATLTVEVLGKEWTRLPVRFGDAAVGEAANGEGEVLLRGVGDGNYELLAFGQGRHTIALELVTRVQVSPEGKRFTLDCPPVGVSNLELSIPEADVAVQVTPRRTAQASPREKNTTVRAAIGSTERFTVSWQPKAGAAEMAGLASVSDTIEIDVGDGVVHTHAIFDYQILRGSLDTLEVTLPAGERLLDVQAPGLRDWRADAADGRQRLTVRLHAPASEKLRLELRTESPIPDGPITLAQLQVVGAARESGILAVRSAEDVGLDFVTHESITRIDAADVPEPLRKPRSTFYKFFSPSFRLAVVASALEPRVAVDSFLTVSFEKARLSTRGEFKYDVSRAGIFAVRFRLPAGFNLDEVRCDVMDRHEIGGDDDGQVLTLYLTKKVLGELRVAVSASQPRADESGDVTLPLLEPLGVPREQGLVAVIAPESLEVSSDAKRLESARAATPAELAARGFAPQPPQGATLAAAFAFSRRPVQIGLATRQRPRRVFATVATAATVKEDVVQVTTTIAYEIQYAGTDTFRIAVPAAVSDRLQFAPDGIKEKRPEDKPEPDGAVVWKIVLHAEALGTRSFTVTYEQKLAIPDKGVTHELRPIRALDVDRETGEIAILKDKALAIAATADGLEEIDARELTQPAAGGQPHLSYRYFRHPTRLTLAVTKHELEGVVRTRRAAVSSRRDRTAGGACRSATARSASRPDSRARRSTSANSCFAYKTIGSPIRCSG